jgi:hypothetical protein
MPKELVLTARAEAIRRGANLSAIVRQMVKMWLAGEIELPTQEEVPPED